MDQLPTKSQKPKEFQIHFLVVIAGVLLLLGAGIVLAVFQFKREGDFAKHVQETNLEKQKFRLAREKLEEDTKIATAKVAQTELVEQLRVFKEIFSVRNAKFNKFIIQSSVLLTNETGRYVAGSEQYFPVAFTLFQTNTLKIASPAAVNTIMEASLKLEKQIQTMTNGFVPSPELTKALRHDIQWLQEQITFIDIAQGSLNAIQKGIESEIRGGLKPAKDTLDVAVQRRDYYESIRPRGYAPVKDEVRQELLRRFPGLNPSKPLTNR